MFALVRAWLLLVGVVAAEDEQPACAGAVLRYFNVRGRGEAIRLALHDCGVPFEDASFTGDEWGKDRDDGLKAKWTADGLLAFGQVPLLEVDGVSIVQSHSILRYLGRKVGWYQGSAAELAVIDQIADGTEDVRKRLSAIKYADISEEEKQDKYKHYFEAPMEGALWLGYLEKQVARSATGFASSSPDATHADYLLLDLLDYHDQLGGKAATALLATLPALLEWRSMMIARPRLKAYLESPARRAS